MKSRVTKEMKTWTRWTKHYISFEPLCLFFTLQNAASINNYVTQLFFVLSYLTCVQGVRENFRIHSRARFVKSYYFVPTKYIQLTSLGSAKISTYMREPPLEDLSTYEFVELCLKRVTQIEPNRSKQYNKETKML